MIWNCISLKVVQRQYIETFCSCITFMKWAKPSLKKKKCQHCCLRTYMYCLTFIPLLYKFAKYPVYTKAAIYQHEGWILDCAQITLNAWPQLILNELRFRKGQFSLLLVVFSFSVALLYLQLWTVFAECSWAHAVISRTKCAVRRPKKIAALFIM